MIRRGDVYLADLDPVVGREQAGLRPVVIVSADRINARPLVVMAIPGTSADRVDVDYRLNVRVSAAQTGLRKDTVFLCFQARALDASRLRDPATGNLRRLGAVTPGHMADIDTALRRVLSL